MYEWHSFAYQGDQFLVGYACAPVAASSVEIFLVGHALELYLKAAHAKRFGDVQKAIAFGHNVKDLWEACKEGDGAFLPNHELRYSIFSVDFFDPKVVEALAPDDQLHFIQNQNLYIIAKHLPDLKYFGLPWKTLRKGQRSMALMHHDPYWIVLFRDIRQYLGHPPKDGADFVKQHLAIGMLPPAATEYLSGFYT